MSATVEKLQAAIATLAAAVDAEVSKRQALEAQVAELSAKLAAAPQPEAVAAEKAADEAAMTAAADAAAAAAAKLQS